MKKIPILILLLLAMLAGVIFLKPSGNRKSTLEGSDRNFAVDKSLVHKIEVIAKDQEAQVFELAKDGAWYINGKYKASEFSMAYMLSTIEKMKINNIPPKSATKNLIAEFGQVGINLRIYDEKDALLRSIMIGSDNKSGTNMMIEGSGQPYNVYLKGMDGGLRSRFKQELDRWRDREVFQYSPQDIAAITIKYPKDEKSSFVMDVMSMEEVQLKPLSQYISPKSGAINQTAAISYLSEYNRLYAEDIDNQNIKRDSISSLIPFATVMITDKKGNTKEADFYPFRDLLLKNVNTREAKEAEQIERYFVNVKGGDFFVVQNRIFKNIFRPYEYFFVDKN